MAKHATIHEAAERCKEPNFKAIYELLSEKISRYKGIRDSAKISPIAHTTDEIDGIKTSLFNAQKAAYVKGGTHFCTLNEMKEETKLKLDGFFKKTADGFYNPANSVGTGADPSLLSTSYAPILVSPQEASSIYANGGLASIIVDKKSKGVILNDFKLESDSFSSRELADLKAYAFAVGFAASLSDGMRDSCLYGGSGIFPLLKNDDCFTVGMTAQQLITRRLLHKDCISRFVSVDRFNIVQIPNYDLCASDYLNPLSVYIPISGIEVHRDRFSRIIIHPQPYWTALQNLGWGISDLSSYMRALYGYEITVMTVPVMVQQMSLLVHELPLDGLIVQNGVAAAREWQEENEAQMRSWSILNPKAINSFGKFTAVERSYSGFDFLMDSLKKDISAKSGLPESVIFFSKPTSMFQQSEEDTLLKQSETIRLIQNTVAGQVGNNIAFLAASLWGCNSLEDWEKYKTIKISFDSPIISSPSQKAAIGQQYANTISTLIQSGFDQQTSLKLASRLIGATELPSDIFDTLNLNNEMEKQENVNVSGQMNNIGANVQATDVEMPSHDVSETQYQTQKVVTEEQQ